MAQFGLGLCYMNGDGVEKDEAKAVELYTKAAEQGHDDALIELKSLELNLENFLGQLSWDYTMTELLPLGHSTE